MSESVLSQTLTFKEAVSYFASMVKKTLDELEENCQKVVDSASVLETTLMVMQIRSIGFSTNKIPEVIHGMMQINHPEVSLENLTQQIFSLDEIKDIRQRLDRIYRTLAEENRFSRHFIREHTSDAALETGSIKIDDPGGGGLPH